MYVRLKIMLKPSMLARNWLKEKSSIACQVSLIKINYSLYKQDKLSLHFSITNCYSIFIFTKFKLSISLKSNLLLCWHGFYDLIRSHCPSKVRFHRMDKRVPNDPINEVYSSLMLEG